MKKSKIMYLMSAALLLAGCAADEQQVPVSQRVPITLNTLMVEGSLTRADNVNIQSTQFDKNQTFYAYFPENVTVGEVTSASHAVYTTDGEGNTTTDLQPYFNAGEESATVHAYYPYIAGDGGKLVTNATESFSVEKNQHQVSGYNKSDLMYATTTVEKTSPIGTLLFTHKMAKIIVNASAADNLTITDVRIVGGYRTIAIPEAGRVSCTLSTEASGLSDANSTSDYITMFTGGNNATAVCAALLPPQELSSNNALIEIVTKDANKIVASAKYSIAKTIESANSYTLNLTVTQASLNNTTAISNWSNNSASTNTGDLVIGDIEDQILTGQSSNPEPIVSSGGTPLEKGTDYELFYLNNEEATTAAVVFAVGKGDYDGVMTSKIFTIVYKHISSAETSDIGKVVCSTGQIFNSVTIAENKGLTPCGILVHVGDEGSADNSGNYKTLVFALKDANEENNGCKWASSSGDHLQDVGGMVSNSYVLDISKNNGILYTNTLVSKGSSFAAAYKAKNFNVQRPEGASQWFLPTVYQWNLIVKGLTGSSTDLKYGSNYNSLYQKANINRIITAIGAEELKSTEYWSSMQYNSTNWAWYMAFDGGVYYERDQTATYYVRAVFAY